MAIALEDEGGAVALGGGIGRWLEIAVAALGGGGGRRTCNNGIGIYVGADVVKAKGLLLRRWCQHWQGGQKRTHPMQGTYLNSNGKEIGVSRRLLWWRRCRCEDGAGKARARGQRHGTTVAQARQGQCNDGIAKEVTVERENG
jgi:hypothetical protein